MSPVDYHGWTHAPKEQGGTDPIPGLGTTGGSGYASPLLIPLRELWTCDNQIEATGNYGSNNWTIDTTYPGGGYLQNTTDGGYMSFICTLGPKGSVWSVVAMLGEGTDYGKVDIDIGNLPDVTGGFYTPTEDGLIENAPNNWVTFYTLDLYAAVGSVWRILSAVQTFRIMGDEGDLGTAFAAGGGWGKEWNGGPGAYRVRLRTNGKNALSSAFRTRISGVALVRYDVQELP